MTGVAAATPKPPVAAQRAPLAPKALAKPKPSAKPADPTLDVRRKPALAKRSTSTPLAMSADAAPAGSGLSRIGVSPDLNCSADMDSYPAHPGVFYRDTACATVLVVNGATYGPASIPAGPAPDFAWTAVSQTSTGGGAAGDPLVITTTVAAGDTGVTLTETDTFVTGSLEWLTSVSVAVPEGVVVSRLTRGQDCYVAASDYGIGQAQSSTSTSFCEGRTAALGLRPTMSGATWYEADFSTVWSAVFGAGDLPNTYDPNEDDNGQAVSWALPRTAGTFVRSWRTFVVLGTSPEEQGGAPNASLHGTTCSTSNPVNCATGDFWHTFTDVSVPARGLPLTFARTYDLATATTAGRLGSGWHDSFDLSVQVTGNQAIVEQENGARLAFASDGSGGWTADARVLARLAAQPGGGWRFRRQNDGYDFVFAASGRLTSVVADDGEALTFSYDPHGHLTSVSQPGGGRISLGWTGDRITEVSGPGDRPTLYTYSASGDLSGATGPDGAVWRFGYDDAHHLLTMTDPLGRSTTNTLDAQLRVTKQVQPDGRSITWAYAGDPATPAGGSTTMTDERGSVTRYEYQSMLQLAQTIAVGTSAETTFRFDYDLLTLGLVGRTDPLGRKLRFEYDILGRLVASTDAVGETTRFTYDGTSSRRTATVLPSGRTATSTYDSSGRVVSSRDAGGTETTYSYGDPQHPGDLTSTTTAGRTHQVSYDALGTAVRESIDQTVLFDSTTDESGRPLCRVGGAQYAAGVRCGNPSGVTTYGYDAAGRQTRATDPAGRTTTVQYDAVGNRIAATDPAGTRTTFAYDGLDRITMTTEAVGTAKARTTTVAYDVPAGQNGCPADLSDAMTCVITSDGGRRTTIQIDDAAARTIAMIRPGGARTRLEHDQAGQVTSKEDSAGRITSYGYDSVGRVIDTRYSEAGTPAVAYRYDVDGRRVQLDDGTGQTVYEYDAAGRLAAQTTPAGTVRATYNALGEQTALAYPDGSTVIRSYDGLGRMTATTDWAGRTTNFRYDEDGHTLTTAYPNGRTVTSAYDASGAPVQQSVDGSAPLSMTWTRDALGRVSKETTQGLPGAASTAIAYDPLGQLSAFGTAAVTADSSGSPTTLGTAQQTFTPGLALAGRTDGPRSSTFAAGGTGSRNSVAGSNGSATMLSYDQADRLTSFAAIDGPDIKQLSSSSGSSAGGQTVTVTGSGFAPGAVVRFGATAASQVVVASSTSLTAVVPAGSGAVDVRVTTPVGTSAVVPAGRWTYLKPTVTGLSPVRGPAAGGQVVLINGWNLTGATAVRFGTKAAPFTVVSAQQLRATAPSGAAGVAGVTVTTPQGTSTAAQYTYVAVPVVTAISAGTAPRRGGTTITVSGMNFTGATLVRFGSVRATSFRVVSASSLTAVVPAGTGTVHVTVTTKSGTSAATTADVLTYAAGPGVLRLTPASVRSTGGVKVTVAGFGFTTASVVLVNGKSVTRTYSSTTALVATVPAGTGVVHVQVRNGTIASPLWNGDRLTYLAPAVTKLSASTGILAGGQRITVTGTRLTGATAVTFGAKAGTSVVVSSATSLVVTVPAGAAGVVDLRVTTPEGTSAVVAADKWSYTNLPLVTGVNRPVLSAQGGQTLTVTGSNLAGATELIIGSTRVPVDDSTAGTATATAPAGTGTVAVRAVSSYGTSTTSVSVTYTTLDERYQYNGDGLRVATTGADGTPRTTIWDPFSGIARPLVDGNLRFVYGADGLPIEQIAADGSALYFVHDQLGSTRALLDSGGAVAATFAYGPFGQLTARTGTATTPILFAGAYQDPTGLIYLINRYLDPATGVFLTVDPAWQFTGQPYTYGAGDPVNSTDPTGLWPTVVIGAIMGAVVGAAAGAYSYAVSDEPDRDLVRSMFGGAIGGAISGACIGSGVGVLASTACGAAAGAAEDFITRGKFDDDLAESALTGAILSAAGGGVAKKLRNSIKANDARWGGLKAGNLWHPGKIASGMWKEVGKDALWSSALDGANSIWGQPRRQPEDWLADQLRCGLV